jgi:hypothetical protein
MPQRSKRSAIKKATESFRFRFLTGFLHKEPIGLHWRKDKNRFDVYMPHSNIKWMAELTPRYMLFKPIEKLPGVKEIHYNFPFLFGIWPHRTVVWADGKKTHSRINNTWLIANKYDVEDDYAVFKKTLSKL